MIHAFLCNQKPHVWKIAAIPLLALFSDVQYIFQGENR